MVSQNKGDGLEGGPASKASSDKRFAAMYTDPRFQRFPKQRAKVAIDERFAGALSVTKIRNLSQELHISDASAYVHEERMDAAQEPELGLGVHPLGMYAAWLCILNM